MKRRTQFLKNFARQPSYLDTLDLGRDESINGFGIYAKDGESGDGGGGGDSSGDDSGKDDADSGDSGKDDKGGKSDELDPEHARAIKDMMKYKARAKEADEKLAGMGNKMTEMESKLSELTGALGDKSVEDIQGLLQSQKDAETKELERKGEYDKIVDSLKTEHDSKIKQMAEAHQASTKTLEEQIEALTSQESARAAQLDELTVGRAFGESAFIREQSVLPPSVARKEFGNHFDLVEGQIVAFDKPRGTEGRAALVDANGVNKGFEEALTTLYSGHSDADQLIRSTKKPGAGSQSKDDLGGEGEGDSKPELRGVDRIAKAMKK